MEINIKKDDFLNGIKIVEKSTAQKNDRPVLSNILIESVANDVIRLCATDFNFTTSYKTKAEVVKEGKITLNAKKISEIVSKMASDKPINIKSDEETNLIKIGSGKTEFELNYIKADEFPEILKDEQNAEEKEIELNKEFLSKAIKQVIFSASTQESANVLSGVCFNLSESAIELTTTDGNRLTTVNKPNKESNNVKEATFVVPAKGLLEAQRISTLLEDEKIKIKVKKSRICFIFNNCIFESPLIEGNYPKYQQLIPVNCEKTVKINTQSLINAIERIATVVNERTNVIKFNFTTNTLEISADTPDAGKGKDILDIDYTSDDLLIGFNYKFVLDSLKNIETKDVKIEITSALSAVLFKPVEEEKDGDEDKEKYICLIMPVQVK